MVTPDFKNFVDATCGQRHDILLSRSFACTLCKKTPIKHGISEECHNRDSGSCLFIQKLKSFLFSLSPTATVNTLTLRTSGAMEEFVFPHYSRVPRTVTTLCLIVCVSNQQPVDTRIIDYCCIAVGLTNNLGLYRACVRQVHCMELARCYCTDPTQISFPKDKLYFGVWRKHYVPNVLACLVYRSLLICLSFFVFLRVCKCCVLYVCR